MIIQIITIIISIVLYITAPQSYSSTHCFLSFFVFLYSAFKVLEYDFKNINIINFNLFYLFSFLFCTYIFPLVLMPMGETGYLYRSSVLGVNESSVNVCTALASVAISAYAFAYRKYVHVSVGRNSHNICISKLLNLFTILITIAIAFTTILFIGSNPDSVAMTESPFLHVIFYSLLAINLVTSCRSQSHPQARPFKFFINKCKVPIFCSMIIALLMLYIGDRGPIMSIGFIYLGSYSIFLKKIKLKFLVPLFITGVVCMFLIGALRSGDSSIRSGGVSGFSSSAKELVTSDNSTVLSFFSDFTNRYIELYSGYEYHEQNGNYYPLKIIPIMASPLPLFPNIISELIYGKPFLELSSVKAINSNIFQSRDGWFGTHQVIDVFMSWGIIGVLIIFYLQGYLFAKISSYHKVSVLCGILYIILLSKSVYLPRAVFFDLYRPIVWTYIFYILFVKKKINYE